MSVVARVISVVADPSGGDDIDLEAAVARETGKPLTHGQPAFEAAVFAAAASDVTHVLVDGRVVVADGRHATLDVPAELQVSIAELLD